MTYFLNEHRRAELIVNLLNLTMPVQMAQTLAHFPSDYYRLDRELADVLWEMIQHFRGLAEAVELRDDCKVRELEALTSADLLVVKAYMGEITRRDIPPKTSPSDGARYSGCLSGKCRV
jgi:hypothetical protein